MNGQAVEQNNKLALQYFQMGAKTGKKDTCVHRSAISSNDKI